MASKKRQRTSVFSDVESGPVSVRQASDLRGLGFRRCKRTFMWHLDEENTSLAHLSREEVPPVAEVPRYSRIGWSSDMGRSTNATAQPYP
jgi:hypothetical protein